MNEDELREELELYGQIIDELVEALGPAGDDIFKEIYDRLAGDE